MKRSTLFFFVKEIFWGVVNAFLMIIAGILIAGFFIYKNQTPSIKEISNFEPPQTTVIYDRTGEHILYEIHGEENRKVLSHDQIPNSIRLATVAVEDKDFYSHFGVDFLAILRAFRTNLEENAVRQGGSTITQQLARNIYLTREKTLYRKIMEAIIAIKIERSLTKDEILDMYLNEVPYGSNTYGIEAAAQKFFGKDAIDLTLDEAAMLASLPKAPTYYSPYGNNTKALYARYRETLNKIRELKLAPEDQIKTAESFDIFSEILPFKEPIVAPHFVFYVIEKLEEKYGQAFLEKGGLKVYTTLNFDLQKKAEQIVSEGVLKNQSRGATNAALVAINPKNGEILTMVGSKDYFDQTIDGQVNVTTQLRQPGSSFKPIVYATAFEKGFQPETLVDDAPTDFGPDGGGRDYVPRNYDGKFHGVLPMRKTLAMSLNIPAIKTLSMAGIDNAIDMAHRLGITSLNDRKRYGLSLAIGGAEVRPLDLTAAFSVFADDGKRYPAHSIAKIVDRDGLVENEDVAGVQVLSSDVARKINSILSDNDARTPIFGARSPLYIPGRTVAAKTGTTQEFRDAWTVGYTPSLAVGVWAGNNDGRPMRGGSDGVFVAAPIWRSFMDKALNSNINETFIGYQSSVSPDRIVLGVEDKKISKDEKKNKKDKKKKKH